MAATTIGVNDPKAVRRYSAFLAVDVGRESYFNRKFMGVGVEAQTPIQMLPHLENDSGDQISYDLVMQLKMQPIEGDNTLRGKEEDLKFYTDTVFIDQMRGGVNTGGKMTRKRTIHDLRKVARVRQSEWWARVFDELVFMYLSGGRGDNADYIFPLGYAGLAGNTMHAPDSEHNLFGNDATANSNLGNNDWFDLKLIDRAVTKASTMGGGTSGVPAIEPIRINGEEHYVIVMHPLQEHSLRITTSTGSWLDIQKAAAGAEGRNSPIFQGGLGMYRNVVLHSHRAVTTYTASTAYNGTSTTPSHKSARAMFMGRQAGVVAFGSPGTGLRFDWNEEYEDRANQVVITTGSIVGVKKTRFNSTDFGMISLDTSVDTTMAN